VTVPAGFVHRFIPSDPSGTADGCSLLLLHGTGGNEDDLLPLGRALAPGAALLSPRGKVLERGMPRFFRRLAEGVFDVDDLKQRTHELAAFVHEACATYGVDPARVAAVGFSNGANMAASLLLLHSGLLRGAVLFRPMVPLVPEPLPDLSGTPVFVAAGRADPLVSPALTEQLATLLKACGAAVTVHWDPGGHGLSAAEVAAAQAWIATSLPCRP
jgi:predicted esterase